MDWKGSRARCGLIMVFDGQKKMYRHHKIQFTGTKAAAGVMINLIQSNRTKKTPFRATMLLNTFEIPSRFLAGRLPNSASVRAFPSSDGCHMLLSTSPPGHIYTTILDM